jgi:hypothetical protein
LNLVLGAVQGLEAEAIAPFLVSLYRTGFSGQVAFWVSAVTPRTRDFLKDYGVNIIQVEDEVSAFMRTPVNSLRYFVYQQSMKGLNASVENVLLADTRDVLFQRDPFEIPLDGKLGCFLEEEQIPIRACVANSGWLAAAYGKEIMEELGDFPIACSGTTLGPIDQIRTYVDAMTAGLRAIDARVPHIMHVIPGIDQGVHNYLLRTGALPEARCFRNEDGPILTLNYVAQDSIRFNDDGFVLNASGEVAHVLHQYDRHPEIVRRASAWLNAAS